ncbi:putative ankyrin repeat protein [Botrytis fragariae]|uniref:Putative ankyrin repeat protein n=1 Tax=Botrytis fragariae TaxID=1964551 RepID=A0A8H6AJE5_9HELO|nr:putative ankyrin repeat protein [Botrytis fragariae]KAF5868333.1 putative ankyrin repeat protein [Botrytis fragariae]
MQYPTILLLSLASRVVADGTDVTNNLFSDLGPLLALFGDSFAQQFLRESFTWLDHIIFAMAPLGIITAIIGAIRVGGPPHLRALIGRARENKASAELDFMSSTSHEVSELWNGEGIVRTMGKGKVKQIIFLKGRGVPENCELFTLSDNDDLMRSKAYMGPFVEKSQSVWKAVIQLWKTVKRVEVPSKDPRNKSKEARSEKGELDRAPNISLNTHPKQNMFELALAAILGIVLQAGVIIFSGFVAYDNRLGAMVGGAPSAYAFPILASGTIILVLGMGICAVVIGKSTDEVAWELKPEEKGKETVNSGLASCAKTTTLGTGDQEPTFKAPKDSDPESLTPKRHQKSCWELILKACGHYSGKEKTKLNPKAKENNKILVFWLQKHFVVSDQTFESYLLMSGTEQDIILTSSRSNNPSNRKHLSSTSQETSNIPQLDSESGFDQVHSLRKSGPQTQFSDLASHELKTSLSYDSTTQKSVSISKSRPPDQPVSFWLNTLCVLGTFTGITGFVLQFEGFRGISWACSIAQLVAIMIMTVVRAIIRRGMLDRPIAQMIPEKYEIDWLALRIGNDDRYLSSLSKSTARHPYISPYNPSWKVCSQINPLVQVTSGWMPITNEDSFKAQMVLNVRNRLRELTGWSDPVIKANAASAASAIEIIMSLFEGWSDSTFHWLIDVKIGKDEDTTTQKIKLHATRKTEANLWSVSAKDIESILSLWMYHSSYNCQSGNRAQDSTENIARDIHSFQRVIGPSRSTLKRDMAWWAGIESAKALDEFSWDGENDTQCLSMGFCLPGKPNIFFIFSPTAYSTLGISRIYQEGSNEVDHKKITKGADSLKSSHYAMIASVFKEKFFAQHIFSTFLWAIVNSLSLSEKGSEHQTEVVLPGDDELRLNEKQPNWNSFRLTNKKIKQMIKAVKTSGLGTLEDANLLIIPPLSYFDKLPNEGMVDVVRKNAKENELGYRDFACNLYRKLLKLCDDLPPERKFVYKVVSTTVDFLVTATSASETKKYMETSDGDLEKSKRTLVNILRSKHKKCLDMLQSLYAKQGRLKNFGKAGLLDDKTKDKVKKSARNGQTILQKDVIEDTDLSLDEGHMGQFPSATDILGWTPLHYAVIYSLEAVQKLVEKGEELVNKCDLAGRTPLHYAVMKLNVDSKQVNAEEIIKKLLVANARPFQGRDGLVPLHWAVKTGNIEATKLLLGSELHEKTLNFKDYSDMTPLHFAALGGNSEILEILLKKVVNAQDLNAQNRLGRTALHVAVKGIDTDGSSNRAKIIEILIKKEASVAIKDKDDKKALNVAVEMEQKMKSPPLPRPDLSEEPSHLVNISGGILESEHRDNPDNSNDKVGVDEKARNLKQAGKAEILSKEEQLASVIKSLLEKENLTVEGGKLLLWAVENNLKTPFEFLIAWKEIAVDMSQLYTKDGRSILHLAVVAESDTMVDRILKRWKPSNSSSPLKSSLYIDLADHYGRTALMLAASQGYEPGVRKLLAAGVDKDFRDIRGRTALSWGAESGQLDILTQLIESGVALKHEPVEKNSPMFIAVENGKHEATELFLANGADSNEVDNDRNNVLCHAVICGHIECVKVLIEHGAELEKRNSRYQQTALSFAAEKGNLEIVKLLMDFDARLDAQDTDGWTPLIWALKCEHLEVVMFLLGEEVKSVSNRDPYMEQLDSIMTLACSTGDEDLVEQLLNLGVSSNAQDADSGSIALIEASRGGFLGTVKLLLRNQGHVNAMNNAKETPLLLAIRHGFNEITECLLCANANVEITNEVNETPLLLAVRYNNETITRLLLDKGAKTNVASNTGETPLLSATRIGNEDITRLLLEKEACINEANNSNETPLALAVIYRNMNIIRLLLEKGASVNQEWGKYEQTCLLQAIYAEDEELALLLLKSGAKPEREQKYAQNALQEAIWWRAENIVDHLLSFGASAESKDMQGRTAFQFSAQIGALSLLKKLIKESSEGLHLFGPTSHDLQDRDLIHHAFVSGSMDMVSYLIVQFSPNEYDYHRKDINGWTPLHWAAQAGDSEVVKMLLELDSHSDAQVRESIKKWTPRQIASYNKHNNIVILLESLSIPDEILPPAGMSHGSFLCDGCNCKMRGLRFHCQNCADFDFCEKCKFTSDTTHPNHDFDKIGPKRETELEQEISPQQEGGLKQDDSSSENRSVYEDSVKDDIAT